ncbi:MFS-type transporter SLC18B1-like isoform X1 [Lutzomyia longipalpis]|nr:MFS-type transporter SLC18B1-like isoform X1 [Lutzomyia longipalpis]
MFPKFSRRQWLTLIIIGLADFCNAICVSLQSPFFPKEAEAKGCSATEYGLVFGIFELVVFFISPFYGRYINKLGPKMLFNGGIFTSGTTAILFGLLDQVPGHMPFISLAFIIRIIEALGNAAFLTASFAIIAKEFPDNVATTFASLETFFGLGLIVGPTLGGALYAVDGYYLPFVTLGSALFIVGILTIIILPHHSQDTGVTAEKASIFRVLRIPGVLVCTLGICATSSSIGFLTAVLEPHVRQFDLGPVLLGLVFVINGGIYALTAPIWGWIVDKFLNPKIASFVGCILIAAAFCLIGPASFIPLDETLRVIITGLILHGFGIAAILVASFTDALRTSIARGLPDNIQTYGLISGLWTSTFALGAFIGPSVSGFLYDHVGFRNAVIFIIGVHSLVGLILLTFICSKSSNNNYKELDATEPLLKDSNGGTNYTNGQTDENTGSTPIKSHRNGHVLISSSIGSEQQVPCAMNNLLRCNSYNSISKQSQWSRSDHVDTFESRSYGTVEIHPVRLQCHA